MPVISLDSIVWKPRWRKTPAHERLALEDEVIRRSSWIVDGVSSRVRAAADLVIFLDVPRHVCAWRGLKRTLRYLTKTRPGFPEDCPEWRILPRLMKIIWHFPANAGAEIRREASKQANRYRCYRRWDTPMIRSDLERAPDPALPLR